MADAIAMIVRCCIHQRCGTQVDYGEFAAVLARQAEARAQHQLSFQGLSTAERAAGITAWCRACDELFRNFEEADGPCRPRIKR